MRSDYEINVLGTIAFRFVIGTIRGLRSLTSMHYTAQRENLLVGMIDRLTLGHNTHSPQLCAKPRLLEHVLGTIAFRLRFGCVLRGWFVPRTWFDQVPAGTVLAGTVPARTRSDYKKWCVPRTCSENMFPLELYREQVWTPGMCLHYFFDIAIYYSVTFSSWDLIFLLGAYNTIVSFKLVKQFLVLKCKLVQSLNKTELSDEGLIVK